MSCITVYFALQKWIHWEKHSYKTETLIPIFTCKSGTDIHYCAEQKHLLILYGWWWCFKKKTHSDASKVINSWNLSGAGFPDLNYVGLFWDLICEGVIPNMRQGTISAKIKLTTSILKILISNIYIWPLRKI